MAGNRSYYSVLPMLRSKALSRTTKIRMYKTIIRPVVLYGSEVWCLTANGEINCVLGKEGAEKNIWFNMCSRILEEQNKWRGEAIIWRIGHSNRNKKGNIEMAGICGEDE